MGQSCSPRCVRAAAWLKAVLVMPTALCTALLLRAFFGKGRCTPAAMRSSSVVESDTSRTLVTWWRGIA